MENFHKGIDETLSKLESTQTNLQQIQVNVEKFISLEDSFRGRGGDSIRSFYQECHVPFLKFFENVVIQYIDLLKQMSVSLRSMEPSSSGFIRQSFLELELEQGLQKIDFITKELTDEANQIIASVSDIIALREVDDDEFAYQVRLAKQNKCETIEKLNQFDHQQTTSLYPIEDSLKKMRQFIQEISSKFKSKELNIYNFQAKQLEKIESYREIQAATDNENVIRLMVRSLANLLEEDTDKISSVAEEAFNTIKGDIASLFASGRGNSRVRDTDISFQVQSIKSDKEFTDEEEEAIRKYLHGLETGEIEGNMEQGNFGVRSEDYELEYNIFGQPLGGDKPVLDPVSKFIIDIIVGDILTILDKDATTKEKIVAALMMLPPSKLLKIAAKLEEFKKLLEIYLKSKEHVGDNPPKVKAGASNKSINKPTDKPSEKSIDKPASKPSEKSINKPTSKPSEKSIDKPASKPSEKSINKPTSKPSEKSINKPSDIEKVDEIELPKVANGNSGGYSNKKSSVNGSVKKEDGEGTKGTGKVDLTKTTNPEDFLDIVMERQGLDRLPGRFKEKWIDGDYKYEIRAHEAETQYGKTGSIYRVGRQKPGNGTEYMDSNGKWHHESTLKETHKDGRPNPLFNEEAARDTHIQLNR
ncbi:T7SS effector LXG polymorphic toxin [Metabacillus fastidiosus]|uniref:T7SS effector LXG polymorphic toxin n=1 Tax=Metabacillus fastidiosus TaxID=1458 RepID=UPI002E1F15DF|nr:T7SS effector LXG polymorphic toxin [Metabacillus fastidiosus]